MSINRIVWINNKRVSKQHFSDKHYKRNNWYKPPWLDLIWNNFYEQELKSWRRRRKYKSKFFENYFFIYLFYCIIYRYVYIKESNHALNSHSHAFFMLRNNIKILMPNRNLQSEKVSSYFYQMVRLAKYEILISPRHLVSILVSRGHCVVLLHVPWWRCIGFIAFYISHQCPYMYCTELQQ